MFSSEKTIWILKDSGDIFTVFNLSSSWVASYGKDCIDVTLFHTCIITYSWGDKDLVQVTGAMEAVSRQPALHSKRFPCYPKYSCRHYPVQGMAGSVKMRHSHIWGFGMHMRAHLHVTELQGIVLIVQIARFSVPEAHNIRIQMNTCFSGSGLFSCLLLFEPENFKLS